MVVDGSVSSCLTSASPRPRDEPVMSTEAIFSVFSLPLLKNTSTTINVWSEWTSPGLIPPETIKVS